MSEFQWYIVHVTAGSENRIASEMRAQFEKEGHGDKIQEILVPKKYVSTIRSGVKVQVEDRILPGYVLVHMVCSPETLHIVRRVPRVIGMLGSDIMGIPRALADHEVTKFLEQVDRIAVTAQNHFSFEPGELVKVSDGLFSSMEGIVEEVDIHRSRLKVSIAILGRSTPVDLEFTQVEKII